ncbi:hypothetical protein LSH36_152g04036 [Paralvinella palmiformis]|uniref:Uncharacterized protein n=1 Tax=Paralvinella palmiformis TaxID=53620 RepID=A0AAD9JW04_9ANNE|nr:hypothetical protein LSH36_152g04036 [Paralvinella palmiformis]
MKDIIDHIRYQEADTQSSEALLYQIAYMIREWKATRLIAKPETSFIPLYPNYPYLSISSTNHCSTSIF